MAKTKYHITPSSKLNEIDYELGNLIFVEDLHRIYYDGFLGRVCYDSLVQLDYENEREEIEHPFEGFYFVEETKTLWRYYDEEWTIIAKPSGTIRFIDKADLPAEGEAETLYVCGTEMFIWDAVNNKYATTSSSDIAWEDI